ncbi:MAG: hypothetical protein AB7V50_09915 [Vampirovibrionia bacterium]
MTDENQNNIQQDEGSMSDQGNKRPNIPGLSELENISEERWKVIFRHFRIGEHMLQRKLITVTQLSELLEEQKRTGEQLGEMVVRKEIISRKDLLELLHWQHKADKFIMNLLINMEDIEPE